MEHEEYLKANWQTLRVADMAKRLKMTPQALRRLAIRLKLGPRPARPLPHDPNRREIKKRAAEIRSQWTPEERQRREVGIRRPVAWTPPVVLLGEIEAPCFGRI